jgi:DinB superfamily
MTPDEMLRQHVVTQLRGGEGHPDFDTAITGLPARLRGGKPPGQPHTPWRLLEHMRRSQATLLQAIRDPAYLSPTIPDPYWPDAQDGPPTTEAWDQSLDGFRNDLQSLATLVADPATDMLRQIPGAYNQPLLRVLLMIASHNAYHIGQLIMVRRMLGAWK